MLISHSDYYWREQYRKTWRLPILQQLLRRTKRVWVPQHYQLSQRLQPNLCRCVINNRMKGCAVTLTLFYRPHCTPWYTNAIFYRDTLAKSARSPWMCCRSSITRSRGRWAGTRCCRRVLLGGPFDQADFVGSGAGIFCLETVEDLVILSIN